VNFADGGEERAGDDQVDPGDGHQPARLRPVEGVVGDHAIHQRDLGVEEVDLTQPAVERLTFLDRQLELREPRAALLAEQITHPGRPFRRRIKIAWTSFFTRVRASTNCERRDSRRRITRVRSSGIQTLSSEPAANSLASVRASRRSVFARA
jgi:hypothetical protein